MKYLLLIVVLVVAFRTITFAIFCWKHKNKRASIGAFLLALANAAIPFIEGLLMRK